MLLVLTKRSCMKKKLAMPKFGRKAEPKPKHITNETVAEYREQILASGRKFKYPVQYTKRRLITNALIIGALALVIFCGVTYWALYSVKTTSTFFYRLTQVIPLMWMVSRCAILTTCLALNHPKPTSAPRKLHSRIATPITAPRPKPSMPFIKKAP